MHSMHSITASSTGSPCPQSDNTGAVVGGVVALVAVIAVTVVMVMVQERRENVSWFKVVCVVCV